ncbi:hypothetical protein HG530_014862 [Fusarium avenaceum]|nr:hypothetical protein HG530_014862 [Fusarium avenaceum]
MLCSLKDLDSIDVALMLGPGLGAGIDGTQDRTKTTASADILHIVSLGHNVKATCVVGHNSCVKVAEPECLGTIDKISDLALHAP